MITERPTTVRELGHAVGGAAVAGTSGRFGDVYNPASGVVTARVAWTSVTAARTRAVLGPGVSTIGRIELSFQRRAHSSVPATVQRRNLFGPSQSSSFASHFTGST